MKADRDIFGPRLRRERERRGITLKEIAESTKIKESLFAELERGDISRWPQGIFRRAHLCAYVSAIGLPSQPILAEFLRLFPEENPVDPADQAKTTAAIEAPQATNAVVPARPAPRLADQAWRVCFDLAAICLISSIVAGIAGTSPWLAVTLVSLSYSLVGACFSQGVGGYVQRRIRANVQSRSMPPIAMPLREAARRVQTEPAYDRSDRPARISDDGAEIEPEAEVQQRRASA